MNKLADWICSFGKISGWISGLRMKKNSYPQISADKIHEYEADNLIDIYRQNK
jgi:hypothetical protein